MEKAFAVSPTPCNRSEASKHHPLSAQWTLYNPQDLADKLGLSLDVVEKALEETGFAKAVRVRMEVLRWKERLRLEERQLEREKEQLYAGIKRINARLSQVREALTGCRNILRLPRCLENVA